MKQKEKEDYQREMFSLIKKHQDSNMSARAFSRQHNVPEHVFYYWLRKYKKAHNPAEKVFLPVEIASPVLRSPEESRGEILIHYPNGVQVTVDKSVNISRLKALITAI